MNRHRLYLIPAVMFAVCAYGDQPIYSRLSYVVAAIIMGILGMRK